MNAAETLLPNDWDRGDDGISRTVAGDGCRVLIKRRRSAPPGFFVAEAVGLAALRKADSLRTPEVLAVSARGIALEDLGQGRASEADWRRAGVGLARLHAVRGDAFGFDSEGYVGDTPQDNHRDADGFRFFADRRLLPLARLACDRGLLPVETARRIDALCAKLHDLLPDRPAALVHGDLWRGNLHPCADGELALIDAGAVHYGWAAGDLAMLALFGAPPPAFFQAYEGESGLGDWRDYAPLLNLYPLLNHLCLFGDGYRASVQSVVGRYA